MPERKNVPINLSYTEHALTPLEPQSRFGDKLLEIRLVCPQNGASVLKGLNILPWTCLKPVESPNVHPVLILSNFAPMGKCLSCRYCGCIWFWEFRRSGVIEKCLQGLLRVPVRALRKIGKTSTKSVVKARLFHKMFSHYFRQVLKVGAEDE